MKLFTQYNRITLWVLVVFFLLSSLVYYFLMRRLLFRELDLSMTKIEKQIVDYVHTHHAFPVEDSLGDLRITYAATSGPGTATFRLIPPTRGKNTDNIRELDFFMPLDGRWYKVTISRNLEGIGGTARMVLNTAGVTLLIIVIASFLVNRLVFRKLWQPFYTSIAAIGAFQLGRQNGMELPDTRVEEFNYMNDQFRRMAAKVNKEYLILKEFTENASHEMQTPLAIIRSKLDLAIQDQHLSEEQSATLQSAYGAVKKLANLNRSLLLIAKISNDQYSNTTMIDLNDRLYDKIIAFQEIWRGQLQVVYDLRHARIRINADLLDILLNNLFSNASKHNVAKGKVVIRLTEDSVEIKNTGRPVPLDETRMFQRFYKASLEDESNGLGLSIIKQICDLAGITVSYSFAGNLHGFLLQWDGPGR
ncbi:MAG TPA: HAMP domain-containing sensor histidine kinase [Puia sp.]|nr:HAMP domain-containing sensor histidine kinase [Puia sp.]